MAIEFEIEDGTGKSNATTYVTLAEADQHLENTGRKTGLWSGNSAKQTAINAAFVYMFARWSDQWHGIATYEDEAGDWPRRDAVKRTGFVFGSSEIPAEVKNAQIEYAYIHLAQGGLILYPEYDDSNRAVTGKTDKVGPLSEARQFSDRSKPETFRKYPVADNLIKNLVTGGSETELLRM